MVWRRKKTKTELSLNKIFLGSQSVKHTETEQSRLEWGERDTEISEVLRGLPRNLFKDQYYIHSQALSTFVQPKMVTLSERILAGSVINSFKVFICQLIEESLF